MESQPNKTKASVTQVKINNFDNLLNSIEEIKTEIVGSKEKDDKKEASQRLTQSITLGIAVFSLIASLFTVFYNLAKDTDNKIYQRKTDQDNSDFQRESQAYTIWLSYLQMAEQHPDMANGLPEINGQPVRELANRRLTHKQFKPVDIKKFKKYAWFVSNVLAYSERVADLTKGDVGWANAIKKAIHIHIDYISSEVFMEYDLPDYSELLQTDIKEAVEQYNSQKN